MANSKNKHAQISTDRKKWNIIFNALKLMLKKQQSQLEFLVDERNLLSQRLKYIIDRWASDVNMYEDHLSQLKRQISLVELSKLVETKKAAWLVGAKQRDALVYKLKLEHAQSELDDFKEWFDILSHRCPNHEEQDISPNKLYESLKATRGRESSSKEVSMDHCKALEKEVARLKREYEKLSVKNSSDVSALQAEINFVWNQYKEMESNYTNQLQTKNVELSQENEKVMKLLACMEQLQSSNSEKDDTLETLKANITKLEGESNQKDGEISGLAKELESLKSASASSLPVLMHHSGEPSPSSLTRKRKTRNSSAAQEKESSAEQLEATVAILRAKIIELEAETNRKDGEIVTLSKELHLSRSKSASHTPVLKHCTGEPPFSRAKGRGDGRIKGSGTSAELVSEQGCRRSKRKQDDISIDETPKLFTAQFKIPKLKSQSPHGRR